MNEQIKKPSAYTIIYWLIEDKKIKSKNLFTFLELYWPTFILKDDFIFLKEKFSEEEYLKLKKDNTNPEYWINLLTIDHFFLEENDPRETSKFFAQTLVEIWQAKLKKDFPDKAFVVEYLFDDESGDQGLTFYQKEFLN